ncbi:tetratricopeptide repeat protein [Kitasatospora purpeofusca]|uniref:tetratricopeptide repeat protein n=1 Tax=Kitasatospora purpeofusca TaxID=67352 RepID=UPI002E13BDA7|nr:tetratricopeptide repeat protein [Kitasatospora purpeofusca]
MYNEYVSSVVNEFNGGSAETVFQAENVTVNQIFEDRRGCALANLLPPVGIVAARDAELADVLDLFNPALRAPSASPAGILAGLAGAGKTSLALAAGSAIRDLGWFDGTLFVTLHGYALDGASRVTGAAALDRLLRQLGVAGAEIPSGEADREACYRAVMSDLARRGRRLLVVADDASDAAQVRGLLPSEGAHGVLITSRHLLADLDAARVVEVGALSPSGSTEVLGRVLRVARPGDDRAMADPAATAEVVSHCAGLPLALRIVAALLVGEPERVMRDVADSLACARSRLTELEYGDDLAVRAAFELSYRRLEADEARLFPLLAVAPGPRLSQEGAAALAGVPERDVRRLLSALRRAHMVESERVEGLLRYRFHDLLKLYAEERLESEVPPNVREAAADRWLARCLSSAWDFEEQLEGEGGSADALAWFDAELPSLVAAVELATAMGRPRIARALPIALGSYFQARGHVESCITSFEHAVRAARHLGERNSEVGTLVMLTEAYFAAGRLTEARDCQAAQVALREQLGDRSAAADVLHRRGVMERGAGRWGPAAEHHEQALTIYRELGEHDGEARSLASLGDIWSCRGMHQKAVDHYRSALAAGGISSSRMTEGQIRCGLGRSLVMCGNIPEGMAELQESLAIARMRGAWGEEGRVYDIVGSLCRIHDDPRRAERFFRKAIEIFGRCGERDGEARSHYSLADLYYESSRFREAAESAELSVTRRGPKRNPRDMAVRLLLLGRCCEKLGDKGRAARILMDAVPFAEESADEELIGLVHRGLDDCTEEAVRPRRPGAECSATAGTAEAARAGRRRSGAVRLVLSRIRPRAVR